jgi:hypothetical protein
MKTIKLISCFVTLSLVAGCASTSGINGARGPKMVASGYSNEHEQYAEIGVEFSSAGDFFAVFSPSRWSSPVSTGGSLSWLNPNAWSDDAGRTGRILIGEAVIIGGAVAAASGGGGGGGGGGGDLPSSGSAPTGGGGGSAPSVPGSPL